MTFLFSSVALLYLPMSQLFAFVGFNIAERCLYPLTIPLSVIVTLGYARIRDRLPRFKFLFLALIVLNGLKTHSRVLTWRSDEQLSNDGALKGSIKSKVNLAINFAQNERFEDAKTVLNNALRHTNHADIYYNL